MKCKIESLPKWAQKHIELLNAKLSLAVELYHKIEKLNKDMVTIFEKSDLEVKRDK